MGNLVQREPLKLGWNRGRFTHEHKKPAIYPKQCKVGLRLLWRTNRKLHIRFRLVPKLMTLDDLERPKRSVCNVQVPWSHRLEYFENNTWPNSLRLLFGLTPIYVIWCNGNTPKIRVGSWAQKPAYVWNGARLLYSMQSIVDFSVIPKCVTLNDV